MPGSTEGFDRNVARRSTRSLFLAAAASALLLTGCATRYIPNTDVEDTEENRTVVTFCERYRHAVELKDVGELLKLASNEYYEDGGNIDASDDLDYSGLRDYLTLAWHLWTASDEVAETAREFLDTQELTVNNEDGSVKVVRSPRLAFRNGQADFKFGDAKPNQWTDKDGNPVVGRDKVTVWLDKDCEPDFGVVEMPKSRDAGNISDIKLGVAGIRRPQRQAEQAESSDEPF